VSARSPSNLILVMILRAGVLRGTDGEDFVILQLTSCRQKQKRKYTRSA